MHIIQNACNLRYKDAYTSCYICHDKWKKCIKERYTYSTKELPHTKLTNDGLLEGRQKGLDTTGKRAKECKTHKLPLNSCVKAKEHTKLTLHTWDRAKSKKMFNSTLVLRFNQETVHDFILPFLPPCSPHLTPLANGYLERSLCLLYTWRPHRQRPFALVLHLHQHQSRRNLHLQYLAKN
jgi:hypothetical protein